MNAKKPTTHELADMTGDATYLGTDADGTEHYWDSVTQTAWIVSDGCVRMPQSVDHLDDYVSHVRRVAGGWDDLRYDKRMTDEIVDELLEATEVTA